jgi:hypothetical protein
MATLLGVTPVLAQVTERVSQEYLLEARQMQALSLGVHIPLVCFGIARAVGVPLLFVGLAIGVAAIATPEFLAGDRDGDAR